MTKELKLMSWPVRLPSNLFTGFLMINHPPVEGACEFGWGTAPEGVSDSFINELCDYYIQRAEEEKLNAGGMEWDGILATHAEFAEMLTERKIDQLKFYLKYMFTNPLCHGTAQGKYFYDRLIRNIDDIQTNTGFAIYDKFITLMEANAVIPAFSPEEYQTKNDFLKFYTIDPDDYIGLLESSFECDLSAPMYQGNHFGILTKKHGLYSDRDIMALGIAIQIKQAYWNRPDIKICDIGGGVGYLAYWLKKLGFENITYVDLPTVAVSAKYFFETNGVKNVKFISPKEFDGKFDLVVNFDGITTYGEKDAKEYMEKIEANTKHFLSINREIDDYRVSDICNMRRISRNPFWLRKGYITEDYVQETP